MSRPGAGPAGDGAAPRGGVAGSGDAARFERSVRRWMHAYPRRWRVTFGEDLVATALELREPRRRRLGVREGLALVRGGRALRRRELPPWGVRVGATMGSLPRDASVRHRAWLVDYVLSPSMRLPADALLYAGLGALNLSVGLVFDLWFNLLCGVLIPLLALLPCLVPRMRRHREEALWRSFFPGEPVPAELDHVWRRSHRDA